MAYIVVYAHDLRIDSFVYTAQDDTETYKLIHVHVCGIARRGKPRIAVANIDHVWVTVSEAYPSERRNYALCIHLGGEQGSPPVRYYAYAPQSAAQFNVLLHSLSTMQSEVLGLREQTVNQW